MAHVTLEIRYIPAYIRKIVGCNAAAEKILQSCIKHRCIDELFKRITAFGYEVWVPFHRLPKDLWESDKVLLVKKGDTDRLSTDASWKPK